jgi:hypothetical protein
MDFIDHLRQSAFHDVNSLSAVKGDLTGWICKDFAAVFRSNLQSIHKKVNRKLVIVEVGTWKGLSAIAMAQIARQCQIDIDIICVDTWLGAPEFWTWGLTDPTRGMSLLRRSGYPQVYYTFLKNVIDNKVKDVIAPFPISSGEAVEVFNHYNIKADMIYVDASHEYDAVSNDLNRYWTILNAGGCIFGDDYEKRDWLGVVKAVDNFSTTMSLPKEINGVVWSMIKPEL